MPGNTVAVEGLHAASGMTGEAAIEVVAPVASAVAVTPDTVVFASLGDTMALSAEVFDQVGRVMQGAIVSWSSGDTAVAVVDSVGAVTAVAEGTATITAAAGSAAGTAQVVVAQVAGSVMVTPRADTVELGDTLRLSAEAFDGNGHRVAGARFVWLSSDTAVARVDATGLVTGSWEGAATITVSTAKASATAAIRVENPDRAALVALYHGTGGPEWNRRENWLTVAPLGEWHGVRVDEDGRVTELLLNRNALTGPIPAELGNLTKLEYLYLYDNALTGPIPAELGKLAKLEYLYLGHNALTGPIPAELGNLAKLECLYLDGNALTGPIPAELGNLAELVILELSNNALTGPIPTELGKLGRLAWLYLGVNELTGEIPPELHIVL